MLTVSINDKLGNTNLFEIKRIEDLLVDDEARGIEAGILIHFEDDGCKHYKRESNPRGITFYVMNRQGATVARYHI